MTMLLQMYLNMSLNSLSIKNYEREDYRIAVIMS